MSSIASFDDPLGTTVQLAGGKGANLGELSRAGFDVPPGFVVTTAAYTACAEQGVLTPEIVAEIAAAYRALGADPYVAVRSSGTLEDSADSSFAGMHDTYLDVQGVDAVVDAVQRCWRSLGSPRAVTYREQRGIGHDEVAMAVVVQVMVAADASGVMFTGNPLTAANDEVVINASWGLGEAVVSGIVSPDQYTVRIPGLRITERLIATKEVEVVRDPDTGRGTVTRPVAADRQQAQALPDAAVRQLAGLGVRIMAHYDGLPQDVEWALVDGRLHVLQSRPITGVDFAWDCDVADWQDDEETDDTVWSRSFADEVWTGAITPLMFSWRGMSLTSAIRDPAAVLFGRPDLGALRMAKYFRGEAYINLEADRIFAQTAPPISKLAMAMKLPPHMQPAIVGERFSYVDYLKYVARGLAIYPGEAKLYGWITVLDDYFGNRTAEADGLSDTELQALADAELKRYLYKLIAFEQEYNRRVCWPGMFMYSRESMTLLATIMGTWYDGPNRHAFEELITGSPVMTITVREHVALYEMSRLIKDSPMLSAALADLEPGAFFESLAESDAGRAVSALVESFLATSGHRGHADRDIYYPRYRDDPAILHRALQAHVKSDVDPVERERQVNNRRSEVIAEVEDNIARKPLGTLKREAFRHVLAYVLKFQQYRDDERHFIDRSTYSIRKGFLEVGRRLVERGQLVSDRDFWFLTHGELFEVMEGTANMTLAAAKIEGRMRNFDRFREMEWSPPKFISRNRGVSFDPPPSTDDGSDPTLRGVPTSRGQVTATARIVKDLAQIGRVNPGEILVANSTDPGWTPIFAVISGVIVETGGMLSHSSCLAREYGFPALQLEGALRSIPDGSIITLDGDSGEVRFESVGVS